MAGGTVEVKVVRNPKTIEEKIAYLQTQIDEIKEDIEDQEKKITNKINELATKTTKEFQNSRLELRKLEAKIEDVSIGGIQLQLFGVMLVIYGSITGYFT